jgi:hypothetical protein
MAVGGGADTIEDAGLIATIRGILKGDRRTAIAGAVLDFLGSKLKGHKDPPDPNFDTVAQPKNVNFSRLLNGFRLTKAERARVRPLAAAAGRFGGLQEAVNTSVDRAAGAKAVGATQAYVEQLRAAALYTDKMAAVLISLPRLERRLAAVVPRGMRRISAGDVRAFQRAVKRGHLPPAFRRALDLAGITGTDRRALLDRLAHLNPHLGATSDILRGGAKEHRALLRTASTLRAEAASYRVMAGLPPGRGVTIVEVP